jgi:hypothetical protein
VIDSFDHICALLGEKLGVEIIETSEESTNDEYALPAIIIDMENGAITNELEDTTQPSIRSTFSMDVCVPKVFGTKEERRVMRQEAKALLKSMLKELVIEYGSLDYQDVFPRTIPFGTTAEAYCMGVKITLPDEPFDLGL